MFDNEVFNEKQGLNVMHFLKGSFSDIVLLTLSMNIN